MTKTPKKTIEFGIAEATCETCGKVFIVRPEWVFVRYTNVTEHKGKKYFCKYTCMTAYDRMIAEKKQNRKKKRTSD